MYILSPLWTPYLAGFIKTMLKRCHHFTLTDALATIQTINLSVPGSELKKEMNGRGRHLEQKIWFLTINQVQPTGACNRNQ